MEPSLKYRELGMGQPSPNLDVVIRGFLHRAAKHSDDLMVFVGVSTHETVKTKRPGWFGADLLRDIQ